jgi:hypothetical protein
MHSSHFQIGGFVVEAAGEHCFDVALDYSLELFRVRATAPDIRIQIERTARLGDASQPHLFDSGSVWRLYEHDTDLRFDFSTPAMGASPYKQLLVDHKFCNARLLVNKHASGPKTKGPAPLDYPLDELLIMHRLTQEKAIELHGCGIVQADGLGTLFVGHSGAGKSTTTRLWTSSQDVEVLSDDRIILRRDDESKKQVPRFARNDNPFGNEDNQQSNIRMYGTPWHGEAMYASPNSAPLARILILEHGHGNVLTPLSPSEAVAELFARSFVPFHWHEYVDSALAFLEEVVDAVPVYHYAFEPDQRAVDTILNLHD